MSSECKSYTTDLDRVLNGVGEVFDGARRSLLFRRILRGRVGFSEIRNDDLCIALSAKSAGFEQRLLEQDTTLIHV